MAWFLVNIIVPLTIPPLGILLLWIGTPAGAPGSSAANFNLMALVKDGQLAWIAAGMCAAAIYEFVEAIVAYNRFQKPIPDQWFVILIPLLLSIVGAMFVAALGAAYNTSLLATRKPILDWIKHYKTFTSSFIVTLASAITFAVVHFQMLPRSLTYTFPEGP